MGSDFNSAESLGERLRSVSARLLTKEIPIDAGGAEIETIINSLGWPKELQNLGALVHEYSEADLLGFDKEQLGKGIFAELKRVVSRH